MRVRTRKESASLERTHAGREVGKLNSNGANDFLTEFLI